MMNFLEHPEFDGHESVACVNDQAAGLSAIIAIHNTELGPALGGCRYYPYGSTAEAMTDVLRLSRGMSYKNALAGLPFGGGKSVVIGDPRRDKHEAQLEALGEAVNALKGRYVIAEDSGTSPDDMRVIARATPFVSGLEDSISGGDPSPITAQGVYLAIKVALAHLHQRTPLEDFTIAIQGLGKVGYALAKLAKADGVTVVASDLFKPSLDRAVEELGVIPCDDNDILFHECDVLAPCAMGGVLNAATIPRLKTRIVAGAANNQLGTAADGELLRQGGILYCPDFVVNAGGVIEIYHQRLKSDAAKRVESLEVISTNLRKIMDIAAVAGIDTESAAIRLAKDILGGQTATRRSDRAA
jgi:leucine dehydrogenase